MTKGYPWDPDGRILPAPPPPPLPSPPPEPTQPVQEEPKSE